MNTCAENKIKDSTYILVLSKYKMHVPYGWFILSSTANFYLIELPIPKHSYAWFQIILLESMLGTGIQPNEEFPARIRKNWVYKV